MARIIQEDIERYAEQNTTPVPLLYERLRRETYQDTTVPQMQVGSLEGRLLKMLTQLSGARKAIEVGTFTGYSALCIAEGLPQDGTLITCDHNADTGAIARRYFDEAPWGHKIDQRMGDALQTLRSLHGPFDLAFIDADKPNYVHYWDELVPMLSPGGLIIVDNVLWGGSVLAPETDSDHAIVAFNEHANSDDRMEQVMLTVRDGITVARRRT